MPHDSDPTWNETVDRAEEALARADLPSTRSVPPPPGPWAWLRRAAAYLGIFLLAPNLLVVLLGEGVYLVRPPLNVDYALLAPIYVVGGSTLTAVAYGALLAIDLMRSVLPAFHFGPRSAIQAALAVSGLPPAVTLGAGALALAVIVLLALGARRLFRTQPRSIGAAALVLLLGGAAATAEDRLQAPGPEGEATVRMDLVTSALAFLYRGMEGSSTASPGASVRHGVAAATEPVFRALAMDRPLPGRVVLVIVESMGLPVDSAVEALQRAALSAPRIRTRYRLELDTVPFHGTTVPGELRELCQIGASTVEPGADGVPLGDCLPDRLGARGYHSVAVHGFSGVFFHRSAWYPELGFDEVYLGGAVQRLTGSTKRCGLVFVGSCDADIAQWIGRRLMARPDRQLVYWLTLNAHAPFPAPDPALTELQCDGAPRLEPDVCRLLRHHDLVLRALADAAMTPGLGPTLFIIVGDHAPPLATRAGRSRFHPEVVPAYLLWPRGDEDD